MKFTKREMPKSDGNGGMFLKIQDGESKVGVFKGDIYEFYQKWENNKSQLVTSDDPDAKTRFRLNFITKEDGELKAKVFEFGFPVYNMLADLADDYDLEKTAVKITRRGLKLETTYTIIPAKDQPTPAQFKSIDSINLNILEHKDAPKSSSDETEF